MTLTYTNLTSLHHDDAWRIAVHEAGHAIAGVRFEETFDHVEIGDDEHGQVNWTHDWFDPEMDEPSYDRIRTRQTIYAAGAAAEHVYFGEIRRHAEQMLLLRERIVRQIANKCGRDGREIYGPEIGNIRRRRRFQRFAEFFSGKPNAGSTADFAE